MNNVKFGWNPDHPDFRDFGYKLSLTEVPEAASVRQWCSSVEDQKSIGSCSANAAAGALELLEIKNKRPYLDLSRLFIYYNTRLLQGTTAYDSGATIRTTVKSMIKYGAAKESYWPYNIAKYKTKPTSISYKDGLNRQVLEYRRLYSLYEMKDCIASGYPFMFGFSVYSSFMSDEVARTGIANLPKDGDTFEGGHAVLAVSYDDNTRRFTIRNSWGSNWGEGGYFSLPYEYLSDRNLSDDFWQIITME